MLIKQFYRPDRKYWYKLILSGNKFHIIFDLREGTVGRLIKIFPYNKRYTYPTIDEALAVFNSWKREYGE